MKKTDKKLLVLIAVHLAVVLPLACSLNIWMDEASTLHTTQNGFLQTFQNVSDNEKQAPLYFLILSLWRALDDSIFFARLLSVIFGALAIKVFFDLSKKLFAERQAEFITTLFALHPFLIWTSLEIRGYSLIVLLAALILKLFFEAYLTDENDFTRRARKCQFLYVLIAVAALYTNYYLGFLLAANFAVLIALKKFRQAKMYLLHMLAVGAAILPLLWMIKAQFATRAVGAPPQVSLYEGLKTLWNHALTLVFPTELSPPVEPTVASIVRVWAARFGILAIIFILIKNKFRAIDEKMIAFGTISLVVSIFFLIPYFMLGSNYLALRHVAPLFVPLVLFAALLLAAVLPPKSWALFAAVFLFLIPYSIHYQYPHLAKRGDWARVARFIEQNEKPNQPIVVFRAFDALSLPYYYKGANEIFPDKKFFQWAGVNDWSDESALADQTEFTISEIPPGAAEIWLATEDICQDEETRAVCRPLENFVEANYTVIETKDFYKERVRLLRKK